MERKVDSMADAAGLPRRGFLKVGLGFSLALTLAGTLSGLTALLLTSNLSSAAPNMAGDYLLYASKFWVLWPSSRHLSPKIRVFVDHLCTHLHFSAPPPVP